MKPFTFESMAFGEALQLDFFFQKAFTEVKKPCSDELRQALLHLLSAFLPNAPTQWKGHKNHHFIHFLTSANCVCSSKCILGLRWTKNPDTGHCLQTSTLSTTFPSANFHLISCLANHCFLLPAPPPPLLAVPSSIYLQPRWPYACLSVSSFSLYWRRHGWVDKGRVATEKEGFGGKWCRQAGR